MKTKYNIGDRVKIYNYGENKEVAGTVRGIFYDVKIDNKNEGVYAQEERLVPEVEIKETETELSNQAEQFEDITKGMLDTFIRKNHDYGNSYEKDLQEDGLLAAKYAIGNKYRRFANLIKKEAQVNESQVDTLLDMANYCIMTVMHLKQQEGK